MKTPDDYMYGTVLNDLSPQVKELIRDVMTRYAIQCTKEGIDEFARMMDDRKYPLSGTPWDTETVIQSNDGNGKHH